VVAVRASAPQRREPRALTRPPTGPPASLSRGAWSVAATAQANAGIAGQELPPSPPSPARRHTAPPRGCRQPRVVGGRVATPILPRGPAGGWPLAAAPITPRPVRRGKSAQRAPVVVVVVVVVVVATRPVGRCPRTDPPLPPSTADSADPQCAHFLGRTRGRGRRRLARRGGLPAPAPLPRRLPTTSKARRRRRDTREAAAASHLPRDTSCEGDWRVETLAAAMR